MDAELVRGLNDAARTLVEQLDRHGLGNLALFEQQVEHLRGHLLSDDILAPAATETADLRAGLVPTVPYRCPVEGFHEHRFDGPHALAAPAVTETADLRARIQRDARFQDALDALDMAALWLHRTFDLPARSSHQAESWERKARSGRVALRAALVGSTDTEEASDA